MIIDHMYPEEATDKSGLAHMYPNIFLLKKVDFYMIVEFNFFKDIINLTIRI